MSASTTQGEAASSVSAASGTEVDDGPFLVYFSSTSENTHRFVTKLGFPSARIPLRPKEEPLTVDREYVLVVPTYGGGSIRGAVPKQVIKFLNNPDNRALCRGVISSGNTNFGEAYCIAGDIISAKLKVPFLYRYELLGTPTDVARVKEGLDTFWQTR
ncbi:class Ib ribonucleoside-diphosphate reductase assembly flavoprotein NrdI [Actinomyces urogenitalis]|uniref:class Ib ribonucleoside-diphosphate reductase assembly flavoprotein NrdI n=1 Tax=Actinomyces urogenitalis TaxID=103621 RepID=UPI00242B67DF|nr:class Ib ribonucleoside-diphosphate reductase assembly flavoprotein NrdI [Actinomyces urogenitalis]MCI7457621.1 class Ib ribonucleoside-diphosphate reductase assembly flavoprotein NrdI [Actinomyces urogenitalis]